MNEPFYLLSAVLPTDTSPKATREILRLERGISLFSTRVAASQSSCRNCETSEATTNNIEKNATILRISAHAAAWQTLCRKCGRSRYFSFPTYATCCTAEERKVNTLLAQVLVGRRRYRGAIFHRSFARRLDVRTYMRAFSSKYAFVSAWIVSLLPRRNMHLFRLGLLVCFLVEPFARFILFLLLAYVDVSRDAEDRSDRDIRQCYDYVVPRNRVGINYDERNIRG